MNTNLKLDTDSPRGLLPYCEYKQPWQICFQFIFRTSVPAETCDASLSFAPSMLYFH